MKTKFIFATLFADLCLVVVFFTRTIPVEEKVNAPKNGVSTVIAEEVENAIQASVSASKVVVVSTPEPKKEEDNPEQIEAKIYLEENHINVPEYIIEMSEEIGNRYHISPELLQALAWRESRFNPKVVSSANCVGLVQISPRWHKDRMKRLGVTDLTDPYQNMLTGADYLHELSETMEVEEALTTYNQGYCTVVNKYSKEIVALAEILERAHGK